MHSMRWVWALALLAVTAGGAAGATPAARCASAKLKAVEHKLVEKLQCHGASLRAEASPSDVCLARADGRFGVAMARAEVRGGCATIGDADLLGGLADAALADLIRAVTPLPSTTSTTGATTSTTSTTTSSSPTSTSPTAPACPTTTTTLGCAMGATVHRYVVNAIRLPTRRGDFALDLDGDGTSDNRFADVASALVALGLDVQSDLDAAIASGEQVTLVRILSSDPQLTTDECPRAVLLAGQDTASPDFGGTGAFVIDGGVLPATFPGRLAGSLFESPSPATIGTPVQMILPLHLLGGTLRLPLLTAHLQFRVTGGGLVEGELHGAMRASDAATFLSGGLALAFSNLIAIDPTSSTALQITALFDNGGAATAGCGPACRNADGSCAIPGDAVISPCEVSTNNLIVSLLAPDLDLFDAGDTYAPRPSGAGNESISFGIGFTAVGARF